MKTASLLGLSALSLLVLSTGACGGAADVPVTEAGQSVLIPSVVTVTIQDDGGGFTPQPPAGSTCLVGARRYTITLATGAIDWMRCVGDGKVPYKQSTGSVTLTAPQLADLKTVLADIKVSKPSMSCIADASVLRMTVQVGAATQEYLDAETQCFNMTGPLVPRSTLGTALAKLTTLVP